MKYIYIYIYIFMLSISVNFKAINIKAYQTRDISGRNCARRRRTLRMHVYVYVLVRLDIQLHPLIHPYIIHARATNSTSRSSLTPGVIAVCPLSLSLSLIHKHMSQVTRVQRSRMKSTIALAIIAVMLAAVAAQDDYIHLPGKTCQDAPACPDGRPCVMAPPRCNSGTCGRDPVPTCGKKP